MEETYLINHPGVRKKILAGGTGPLPHFPPGTKVVCHPDSRSGAGHLHDWRLVHLNAFVILNCITASPVSVRGFLP